MNILYVLSMPSHPNQVVKGGCPLKMTRLNKYKENLYKELGEFHMFNEDTKNEIITLLSKSCDLEIEKLDDVTYLMKPTIGTCGWS